MDVQGAPAQLLPLAVRHDGFLPQQGAVIGDEDGGRFPLHGADGALVDPAGQGHGDLVPHVQPLGRNVHRHIPVQGKGEQGPMLIHDGEDRIVVLAVDGLHPAVHRGFDHGAHRLLGRGGDVLVQLA